jgi:starch phosphorylase
MKAVANGALHVSTRDGWWAEVDQEGLGWNIGGGEEYSEEQKEYGDDVEAQALFDLLEHEIIPTFYQRSADGLPRAWISMMKRSLTNLCPFFNSNRMVRQYTEHFYIPAQNHFRGLFDNNLEGSRKLSEWRRIIHENWHKVELLRFDSQFPDESLVGQTGEVRACLMMAPLLPQDITIEVVYGRIGQNFNIVETGAVPMQLENVEDNKSCCFKGVVPCVSSGKMGFAIRVLPRHRDLPNPYQMGLVKIFGA